MKNILIIAGSDSVGGAGIQADIKTCEAFGCYSATAITALTAQNTDGVSAISEVSGEFLNAQLKMITDELKIDAIKVGMLFNKELILCTKGWIERLNVPTVIDPVCVAKSGAKLLKDDAIDELRELLNLATIATPNIYEARVLNIDTSNLPCDIIFKRTIADEICQDTLHTKAGEIIKFQEELIEPKIMHGAGCSFASALACALALGNDTKEVIKIAKKFILNSIKSAHTSKFGVRILNHKAGFNG